MRKRTKPWQPPDDLTLNQIFDIYLNVHACHLRLRSRQAYETWAIPSREHMGEMRIADIQPADIHNFVAKVKRLNPTLRNDTVRHYVRIIAQATTWGYNNGLYDFKPRIPLPPIGEPRSRVATQEEIDALLAAARTPYLRLFIIIAVNTGARHNAIMKLTWDRVDMTNRIINFHTPGERETKKRNAIVPMNQTLYDAMLQQSHRRKTPYVLEGQRGRVHGCSGAVYALTKKLGIEGISPHVFRHTAASRMANAGVPIWIAGKILGVHVKILEDVYAHFDPEYGRDAVAALEAR